MTSNTVLVLLAAIVLASEVTLAAWLQYQWNWTTVAAMAVIALLFISFLLWRRRSRRELESKVAAPIPTVTDMPGPVRRATVIQPRITNPVVRIFYSTDRVRKPHDFYGAERGEPELGFADISIPHHHRIGELERPALWRLEFREDPARHVVLSSLEHTDESTFLAELHDRVTASSGRAAFVFVHGYNVSFHDAALRTGQLAYDLDFDGAPILYSWPSQGSVAGYSHDETNVEWTIPHLQDFLLMLALQSGALAIHLIAHSMGNRAVAAALRGIAGQVNPSPFREIVLTAPDIDADVFRRDIVPAIAGVGNRLTLYASSNDEALKLSKKFHGYARAGDSQPIVVSPGLETIDVSALDTSLLGHSYYAEHRSVLSDLYYVIRDGSPPDKRFGLKPAAVPAGRYWIFRP